MSNISTPTRYRINVEEYHAIGHALDWPEDKRVELLDGEIIEMNPISSRHATCVRRLTYELVSANDPHTEVSVQNPIRITGFGEPEPDLALLRPRPGGYADAHPTAADTLLVIEVADTSLEYDRMRKLPAYAASGIPEAWLIDLNTHTLEIHRDPRPDGYARVQVHTGSDLLRSPWISAVRVSAFIP